MYKRQAVGLLTEDRTATPDEAQCKAVSVAAAFLAKQMDCLLYTSGEALPCTLEKPAAAGAEGVRPQGKAAVSLRQKDRAIV